MSSAILASTCCVVLIGLAVLGLGRVAGINAILQPAGLGPPRPLGNPGAARR